MVEPLGVVVVDDEPLARSRLRTLVADCANPKARVVGEAANAVQAMEVLKRAAADAVLLDINMPGAGGLSLAQALRSLERAPAVVFVTAHAEHAVTAFELEAVDYLTKPVRRERLEAALQKVLRARDARAISSAASAASAGAEDFLLIQDRGRTERLPLSEVLYLKAEQKYLTVRTATRSLLLDASLSDLEERHGARLLRVHRNALVARAAVRSLERHVDPEEGEGWAVRLDGIAELLSVSRRQLAAVREALGH